MPAATPRYARLRFTQLEMLCAVADAGGIRAAADRLHLSAAAISKALREMEATLGLALFERQPRGMVPTARGERLIAHARLLLNDLEGLAAEAGAAQPPRGGQLTLGAPPYVVARVLPRILAGLPHDEGLGLPVAVRVRDGHLALLIEQLLLGHIEALITLYAAGDLDGTDIAPLAMDTLRQEELAVLCAPGTCGLPRRRMAWRELLPLPWILPPASTHLRRALDTMFHLEGLHSPVPRIEATHLEGNVRLCAAGLGLTLAPLELAREHVAEGRLRVVPLQRPLAASSLMLVYRRASAPYLLGLQALRRAAREAFAPAGA